MPGRDGTISPVERASASVFSLVDGKRHLDFSKNLNSRKNSMANVSQLPRKMDPEEYDLVILGGGTGSTVAAWTFAGKGQRVAAIDRECVGCAQARERPQ